MTETRPEPGSSTGARQTADGPPREAPADRVRLKPVTVDDIVATDVVTAERDTPVVDVIAEMSAEDVGSVVVVEDDSPVGILTDRSIALSLESEPDVSDRRVDDLVSESLVTATTDISVFDALRRLEDESIRRLPIVDEDGTLEGIVTLDDIIVLLGAEFDNAAEIIKDQSPRL